MSDTRKDARTDRVDTREVESRGAARDQSGTAGGEPVGELSGRSASLWADAWRELRRDRIFLAAAAVVTVFVVMAIAPILFTRTDPRACDLSRSLGRPSADSWFGYDLLGCDYYSQVVHGARVSVSIGVLVTLAALVIALVLGSLAGYYGGLVDAVIARLTDVVFGLPFILGAIVILTVFENRGLFQVTLVLAVLGWTTMTRLMRSSVISVRDSDYVLAARALGTSDLRILTRHILPNAIAPVIVYATIYVGIVIAAEATLSFLGVGLQLPAISWGLMISDAQYRIAEAPHLLLFPGLFLSLTVLSFILMGDALRDALDPKLR
ncbi:ABC transporter permease [Knoellia aerolata]|uniref:Peptide ABC transporter permease n=1 Tax=Knoellia aerolata DSM 18566 TaxID=1385519 RepID=A0A0A0K0K0_9MICO|nr:ABC transporter permease [Knoellia aerolata]KGN42953.1 peptide ABC transporter permease [Knoellia aerolata DSM 18566]